jgi:Fic family protein
MKTLEQFSRKPESIPTITSWYLTDLAESRGKQELFTRQAPQRLKTLREHALIESAISSNRIEGVEVDRARIGTILFGKALLRDRNEEEVRGYREGLNWIHEKGMSLPISGQTVLELHRLARGGIWDAGEYREKESDIIEKYPDGRSRIRFKTAEANRIPVLMQRLSELWISCLEERWVHPLIALAAFNLDFLCIHPFRDGNGRVSRLLLLLQCYHVGYEVGRYISLERLIEENKDRYYETLEQSSRGWHEGRNDPWPYVNYVLFILKTACREFEERLQGVKGERGEKTALVLRAIDKASESFRVREIQGRCPGVSVDMVRHVLKNLRSKGRLECMGRGQNAEWRKTRKWGIG